MTTLTAIRRAGNRKAPMIRAPFRILSAALLLAGATAWADCPVEGLTPIHQLRGDGRDALPTGREVRVRGVVTGDFRGRDRLNGFWLQSITPAPDGLPDGVFVYAPDARAGEAPVAAGVEIVVEAQIAEHRGQRQLQRPKTVQRCAAPGLPEPVALPFPPRARDDLHRHVGLLVRIDEPLTVTGHHELQRFGSLHLAAGGRLLRPTNAPAGDAGAGSGDNARRGIVLDDGSYRADPRPTPWLDQGPRRIGDRVDGVRGILTHAFGAFRIHPDRPDAIRFTDANPRPAPPARPQGWRVVGFNVENYFVTTGQRGAKDGAGLERQRRALAAVGAGLDADFYGLVEIENRPAAVADLASVLAAGGRRLAHFALARPVGRDVIRVALLWREDRVTLRAGPFIDDDPVHHRPPIAGHFRFGEDGPEAIVAVIHHKSKSGCPTEGDVDRGQGCWNERRTAQSRALAKFLAGLAASTGVENVLVLGDINAYGNEDPVRLLRDAGLTDVIASRLPAEGRYTYVFQGESGYLDVALASTALARRIAAASIWHINADEPAFLRLRTRGPWRSSDHDPVVIDLAP